LAGGIRVRLIHWSPPPLVVLAAKVSSGKLREKPVEYYLAEYPLKHPDLVREWITKAAESFPSVLEHVTFTFMVEGISRVTSHQLVRHRLASYTQESQRYTLALALDQVPQQYVERVPGAREEYRAKLEAFVLWMEDLAGRLQEVEWLLRQEADSKSVAEIIAGIARSVEPFVVIPPSVHSRPLALAEFLKAVISSLAVYAHLVLAGIPLEDARYVLPQAVRTRVMVTMNLRELLHVLRCRLSPKAQWEIRLVAEMMAREVEEKTGIPVIELARRYEQKAYDRREEREE